jgi:hypothetical protein
MTRAVRKGSITAKPGRTVTVTTILQTQNTLGIQVLMHGGVDQEAARRVFHCIDRGREAVVVTIHD